MNKRIKHSRQCFQLFTTKFDDREIYEILSNYLIFCKGKIQLLFDYSQKKKDLIQGYLKCIKKTSISSLYLENPKIQLSSFKSINFQSLQKLNIQYPILYSIQFLQLFKFPKLKSLSLILKNNLQLYSLRKISFQNLNLISIDLMENQYQHKLLAFQQNGNFVRQMNTPKLLNFVLQPKNFAINNKINSLEKSKWKNIKYDPIVKFENLQ